MERLCFTLYKLIICTVKYHLTSIFVHQSSGVFTSAPADQELSGGGKLIRNHFLLISAIRLLGDLAPKIHKHTVAPNSVLYV